MPQLRLIKSYDEIGNIRTFVFEPSGEAWRAGQYQAYTLPQIEGDKKENRRFFTIASAPYENEIHISTRVSDSAFKQALNSLQSGDTIEAKDIDGDFLWEDDEPVVLVAAGIGVTPYRSILLERAHAGKSLNAHVLYFGRDNDFAFRDEFNRLAENHPELVIDYIAGQRVTADSILEHAPEAKDQTIYISGPELMVDTIGDELKSRGIALKQDWFPGYTEETF